MKETRGIPPSAARSEAADAATDVLTRDQIFSLLSSRRRRLVIRELARYDGPAEVGTLAELIAARENDTDREELTSQQRKRAYTSLYQTHLPKLADAGLVEYDRAEGVVTLTDRVVQLRPYLDVQSSTIPWYRRYLSLSAVTAGLLLLGTLDVFPLSAVPDIAYAVSVAALFVLLSVIHAVSA